MSKYFDTKPGSLEEAVSAAQQAAIAISKKEKGEKPKEENNFIYAAKMAKKNGEKTFTIGNKEYEVEKVECPKCEGKGCEHCEGKGYHEEGFKTETNKNDKSDDGDGLDAVQPDAVKKKFDDRKDKDIDNDGDVDSTDKYLHKRRKAISKSMSESLKETVLNMWKEAAKKESQDMEQDKDGDGMDDDGKAKKTAKKTDSGKDMTPVDTSPKMPKTKTEKNKV